MAQAKFTKTYNAFSGVDMIVTFAGRWIGELQGISYSVTREKVPGYTLGSANPRAFSRGKRGIAGALVFLTLDRSALLEEMNQIRGQTNTDVGRGGGNAFGTSGGNTVFPDGLQHFEKDQFTATNDVVIDSIKLEQQNNIYFDQILPFNVVITGANEYGATTSMELVGLELLNSGSGMSIDDVQINETCSFLARDIRHWKSIGNAGTGAQNLTAGRK